MKFTAWAVMLAGLMIGIYGVFASLTPGPNVVPPAQAPATPLSLGTVLLGFAGVVVAAGVGMLLLGGRGTIRTKNLSVRN